MSEPRPRLSAEARQAAVGAAERAIRGQRFPSATTIAEAAVDAVIDALWQKLRADAQDRINTLIYAAKSVVERGGGPVDGLRKALGELAGREVAATATKQLREGPWHG